MEKNIELKNKINRIKFLGLKNFFLCLLQRLIFTLFRFFYKFDPWHSQSPFYCRPYKKRVVKISNSLKPNSVVEIGCGLGEIISRIKAPLKYGIDIDNKVLKVAKILNPKVKYFLGDFKTVFQIPLDSIDLLIMVGFIHGIPPKKLKEELNFLLERKKIKYILADKYYESYKTNGYRHNLEELVNKIKKVKSFKDPEKTRKLILYEVF
jgi:SAM-dependent methyltransferase